MGKWLNILLQSLALELFIKQSFLHWKKYAYPMILLLSLGTTAIQSVLQKDDHVFAIHVLNPREDMDLPDEYEALLESQAMAAVQAASGSAPQKGREGFESALTEETSTDPRRDAYTGEKSEFEKSEKGMRKLQLRVEMLQIAFYIIFSDEKIMWLCCKHIRKIWNTFK